MSDLIVTVIGVLENNGVMLVVVYFALTILE
jgi:hypothetical protein